MRATSRSSQAFLALPAILVLALAFLAPLAQASPDEAVRRQVVLTVDVAVPPSIAASLGTTSLYARMIVNPATRNVLVVDLYPGILAGSLPKGLLSRIVSDILDTIEAAWSAGGSPAGGVTLVYVYTNGEVQRVYRCSLQAFRVPLDRGGIHASVTSAGVGELVLYARGTLTYRDGLRASFTYEVSLIQSSSAPCGRPVDGYAKALTGALSLLVVVGAVYSIARRPRPRLPQVVVVGPGLG